MTRQSVAVVTAISGLILLAAPFAGSAQTHCAKIEYIELRDMGTEDLLKMYCKNVKNGTALHRDSLDKLKLYLDDTERALLAEVRGDKAATMRRKMAWDDQKRASDAASVCDEQSRRITTILKSRSVDLLKCDSTTGLLPQ